jgi:uncharacterized repeat protein (TIGR03803 family)
MRTCSSSAAARTFAIVAVTVILAISAWAQPTEKIIYSFTGSADGGSPQAGLVGDGKGNLYGTTSGGGTGAYCHCGTVFELIPGSNGTWTETVLYSFSASSSDGSSPFGGLVFDSKGDLYGTTLFGGASSQGTAYELSPSTDGTWKESVIYSFPGGASGGAPYSNHLTVDSAGNLYGTASGGSFGAGVVFELTAAANGTWTEKVLHTLTGDDDGDNPYASSLVPDGAGGFYGITRDGGAHDYGVVFRLTPQPDGTWSENVIYAFTADNGESGPISGLLIDAVGNLYGAAYDVFELIPAVNGTPTHKTLHTFPGPPDGAFPQAAPISDKAGNLYGTTYYGGAHYGMVYELMPGADGTWNERVLHRFSDSGGDGAYPTFGSLTMDASGNLYGTTESGGASKAGIVFEVTP